MCYGFLCDCIFRLRCCLFKILIPLWFVDIILSGYIVFQLFNGDVKTCCTNNNINICDNDDIGSSGFNGVSIDSNGYCIAPNSFNCGNGIMSPVTQSFNDCVSNLVGVDITQVCNNDTRNVMSRNYNGWLITIIIIKMFGLLFLIGLEFYNCTRCCRNNKNNNNNNDDEDEEHTYKEKENEIKELEPGRKDAEEISCGKKCENTGKKCLCNLLIFFIKVCVILFGFAVTVLVLYLRVTNNVVRGSCKFLPETLKSQCLAIEASSCTNQDNDNYYNVAFSLDLKGPTWVNLALNGFNTIVWFVRLAVMRYILNKTVLLDV